MDCFQYTMYAPEEQAGSALRFCRTFCTKPWRVLPRLLENSAEFLQDPEIALTFAAAAV